MNKPAISLVSLLALCSCAAQEPIVSLTCGPEESMAGDLKTLAETNRSSVGGASDSVEMEVWVPQGKDAGKQQTVVVKDKKDGSVCITPDPTPM